ncbi:type IV toxin-antitoxin system AbiEi family antitoxin domain-containing protein [Nocardioides mangrovi]|uniref:Type IV toxin-antitoxin system AbiEi family antitoxin domain-containing protein n=1 Tax=Nocardioides mangrovi TaxID=2874580 RepID=A0ABS7UD02_9ACTN|nr:type IV toxin-antitoxin system AbiEi family antitoxin domain-containing protein [Nocardioides mangrovi]MBZ5738538.1 type IV toxin-antitoxin system AbiEi family antitoxin domain-containing protein [Nocardioides mangrovi]
MQTTFGWYLAHQHGLITRKQALRSGLEEDQVRRLLKTGEWIAVRRGVYTTGAYWATLDPNVGRPRLEVWAGVLVTTVPHVVSHDSAAYLHGLPILAEMPRFVHVTRDGALGGTKNGIKHHLAPRTPEQVVFIDDHPVLDLPRTVADIARAHGARHGIVAVNSALRAGVRRKAIKASIEAMEFWPNVRVARRVADWGDKRCETVLEDLVLLMLKEMAIGKIHVQWGFRDSTREAWVDFRVGRHLIEPDGHLKYLPVGQGGVATQPPEKVLWEEKRRQDWLCGYKLGISRPTWTDLQPDTWERTKERLYREIRDTNSRFGTSVADLAPYIIRTPRRGRR